MIKTAIAALITPSPLSDRRIRCHRTPTPRLQRAAAAPTRPSVSRFPVRMAAPLL
jgi:hypothetical protein